MSVRYIIYFIRGRIKYDDIYIIHNEIEINLIIIITIIIKLFMHIVPQKLYISESRQNYTLLDLSINSWR